MFPKGFYGLLNLCLHFLKIARVVSCYVRIFANLYCTISKTSHIVCLALFNVLVPAPVNKARPPVVAGGTVFSTHVQFRFIS